MESHCHHRTPPLCGYIRTKTYHTLKDKEKHNNILQNDQNKGTLLVLGRVANYELPPTTDHQLPSLKLTYPLKIGRDPKKKSDRLPTIHFQGGFTGRVANYQPPTTSYHLSATTYQIPTTIGSSVFLGGAK